jgi:hypothetical protein
MATDVAQPERKSMLLVSLSQSVARIAAGGHERFLFSFSERLF